jgi:hypothetical protein
MSHGWLWMMLATVLVGSSTGWFAAANPAVAVDPVMPRSACVLRQPARADGFTFHSLSGEILDNATAGPAAGFVVGLFGEPAIGVAAGVGAIVGAVTGGVTYAWDSGFGVQVVALAQHPPNTTPN